jgi:putative acetyltransferase
MAGVAVRPLAPAELRLYLDIVTRAIRGLAASHYPAEAIDGWVPHVTDAYLDLLAMNVDGEVRLLAELDGVPAGIGALVPAGEELRACYVLPEMARRGIGSALVREIERVARSNGLARLELAGSLNAERFYLAHGYHARERGHVTLPNGHTLACVWMEKDL